MTDIDPEVRAAWDQALADGLRSESEGVVIWDRELEEAKAQPGPVRAVLVCAKCNDGLGAVHESAHGLLVLARRTEPSMAHFIDDVRQVSPDQHIPHPSTDIAILVARAAPADTVRLRCRKDGDRIVEVALIERRMAASRRRGAQKRVPV